MSTLLSNVAVPRPSAVGGRVSFAVLAALACSHAGSRPRTPSAEPSEPSSSLEACAGRAGDHAEIDVAFRGVPNGPRLRDTICDWFEHDRWRVRFLPHATLSQATHERQSPIDVRLAVIASAPDRVELHFEVLTAASPVRRRWVSSIAIETGLDDAGIEVIAQALHSTTQAIEEVALEGSAAASAPSAAAAAPPPRPASIAESGALLASSTLAGPDGAGELSPMAHAADASPHAVPQHVTVHTALGYHMDYRGREPLTHGPELRIELDSAHYRPITLGSFVNVAAFYSADRQISGLEVALSGASLDVGVAAHLPIERLSPGLSGRVGILGGVDLLGIDVRTSDPEAVRLLGGQTPRPRWSTAVEMGLEHRWGRVELGLLGRLRWQLLATHYDVLIDGSEVTVLRPWRLQPGAALLLAYAW